jgi:menaquinone-dependent protoporphyrinogen oxidase
MKPARDLVERSRGALPDRPVWLFSSGPVGDPPKPEEDPVDVTEIINISRARGHRVALGRSGRVAVEIAIQLTSGPANPGRPALEPMGRSRQAGRQR